MSPFFTLYKTKYILCVNVYELSMSINIVQWSLHKTCKRSGLKSSQGSSTLSKVKRNPWHSPHARLGQPQLGSVTWCWFPSIAPPKKTQDKSQSGSHFMNQLTNDPNICYHQLPSSIRPDTPVGPVGDLKKDNNNNMHLYTQQITQQKRNYSVYLCDLLHWMCHCVGCVSWTLSRHYSHVGGQQHGLPAFCFLFWTIKCTINKW